MSDAADGQQTVSPTPTLAEEDTPDAEGDRGTEPPAIGATATDEPEGDDRSQTIGGEETGLTLEIPDGWIYLPMDADLLRSGVEELDLPEYQVVQFEASLSALGDLDGAIMAIDAGSAGLGATALTDFEGSVRALRGMQRPFGMGMAAIRDHSGRACRRVVPDRAPVQR